MIIYKFIRVFCGVCIEKGASSFVGKNGKKHTLIIQLFISVAHTDNTFHISVADSDNRFFDQEGVFCVTNSTQRGMQKVVRG